jgi:cyclophilin family peptidyl-prolyl cis-trans isomerase
MNSLFVALHALESSAFHQRKGVIKRMRFLDYLKAANQKAVVPVVVSTIATLLAVTVVNNSPVGAANPFKHTLIAAKKSDAAEPIVTMETNKGVIKFRVYKDDAPITAANFLDLVQKGFYNGLTFHRYVPTFCIQGGDPNGNGSGGYIDPKTHNERTIKLEVNPNNPKLSHDAAGVVAMARTAVHDSASSQFYFTLGPATQLDTYDGGYAVFGRVTEGLDVVKALRKGDKIIKVSEK